MNRNRVLVSLDREAADKLMNRIWTNPVPAAWYSIRAAFDRDRETLVSQMADVIEGLDGADYQAVAGAVLALLEGEDDE